MNGDKTMDVGKQIRTERTNKGLSLDNLATTAGVSKRSLIYWEQGTKQMSVENADKVFNALGCSLTIGAR